MIEIVEWPRIALGYSPSTGKDGVDECMRFKQLMRHVLSYLHHREPSECYFETVERDGHRGLMICYNPNEPKALEYAKAAERRAGTAWEMIILGQQEERGR